MPYTPEDRRWTKADIDFGLELISSVRNSPNNITIPAELALNPRRRADICMLLMCVGFGAMRFGSIRRSPPVDGEQQLISGGLTIAPAELLADGKYLDVVKFMTVPGSKLPPPPTKNADLVVVAIFCFVAVEMSASRSRFLIADWRKRYLSLAKALVRKRVAVSVTYRDPA